jgi:Glycosyl hydrolase catalytic core
MTRSAPARNPSRLAVVVTLAAIVAIAATLTAAAPAAAKVPATFYGVSPQVPRPASDYRMMKRGGVDSVRFGIPWSAVETTRGRYDFGAIDPWVTRIARARLEAFPFLAATPAFYGSDFRSLPRTRAARRAWAGFLKAAVRRYGPRGRFWAQHPGIPRRPIRTWQIWNEENFFYFTQPISPKLYGKLVKVSHRAIRSVDRRARVVLGGLFAHPKEGPPKALQGTTFLKRLYRVRRIKRSFEGVALHAYARDAGLLRPYIREFRAIMRRRGDGNVPLYLTELGWGSGRGTAFEKGPRGQVRELTQAFNVIRRMRRSARIKRIFWFAWDDLAGTCNFCDSAGLVTQGGRPKPAWFRYRAFALGRR